MNATTIEKTDDYLSKLDDEWILSIFYPTGCMRFNLSYDYWNGLVPTVPFVRKLIKTTLRQAHNREEACLDLIRFARCDLVRYTDDKIRQAMDRQCGYREKLPVVRERAASLERRYSDQKDRLTEKEKYLKDYYKKKKVPKHIQEAIREEREALKKEKEAVKLAKAKVKDLEKDARGMKQFLSLAANRRKANEEIIRLLEELL